MINNAVAGISEVLGYVNYRKNASSNPPTNCSTSKEYILAVGKRDNAIKNVMYDNLEQKMCTNPTADTKPKFNACLEDIGDSIVNYSINCNYSSTNSDCEKAKNTIHTKAQQCAAVSGCNEN